MKNGSCEDIFPRGKKTGVSPPRISNRDFFQQNLKRGVLSLRVINFNKNGKNTTSLCIQFVFEQEEKKTTKRQFFFTNNIKTQQKVMYGFPEKIAEIPPVTPFFFVAKFFFFFSFFFHFPKKSHTKFCNEFSSK